MHCLTDPSVQYERLATEIHSRMKMKPNVKASPNLGLLSTNITSNSHMCVCVCNKTYHPVHTVHLCFRNACKNILNIRAKDFPIFLSYRLSIAALTLRWIVATLEGKVQTLGRPSGECHRALCNFVVVSTKQTFKHSVQKNLTFQNKEHKIKIYYNSRRE